MDDQSQLPGWLTGRCNPQEPVSDDPYVPARVTIDVWDYHPQTNFDGFKVVICLDGVVVGNPLSQKDGCAVINWLQVAFPRIEKMILDEAERLYEEEAEKQESELT